MNGDPLRILLLTDRDEFALQARASLAAQSACVRVHWFKDRNIASSRLRGGDIDILAIDVDLFADGPSGLKRWLGDLAPAHLPGEQVVLNSRSGKGLPPGDPGGSSHWIKELTDLVRWQMQKRSGTQLDRPRHEAARLVGVIGAKGGAGTTTVALNIACSLARDKRVLLAESTCGSDTLALRIASAPCSDKEFSQLPAKVCRSSDNPRLHLILQSEQTPDGADHSMKEILEVAAARFDYTVVDLGTCVSDAVSRLDSLYIVVNPDALAVECGKRLIRSLTHYVKSGNPAVAAVLLNRSAVACALRAEEVENALGVVVSAAIPPAPDLCSAADRDRRPIVVFQPESMVAQGIDRIVATITDTGGGRGVIPRSKEATISPGAMSHSTRTVANL